LRIRVFRVLWLAVLGSQLGTWMQTVGAQWLLVREPNAGTLVALVQTAGALPVLLLALPAGVLADSLDRRHLLIWVQVFQVGVGAALAGLTLAGVMTPALLLTLTFALGCGMAMTNPAYQAVIPELVPREQIPSAAALGSIGMNLARAVGPALAGVLLARTGVATVFALNAVTFLVFAIVLVLWRRAPTDGAALPEPFVAAVRAGGRYVRNAPIMRRLMLRAAVFVGPAVALWALLPLLAERRLGMDAGGYGLLLGALGVGAVLGALVMGRLIAALSLNRVLLFAGLAYAAVLVVLALVRVPWVVGIALIPAGAAWMAVLSNLNAELQLYLPGWVRARGLATYQTVFFGGQAIGALVWGFVADRIGLVGTLLAAAVVTALGAASVLVAPLLPARHLNRDPATLWPEPRIVEAPEPNAGPVVVEVTYVVGEANEAAFLSEMPRLRLSRRRTGAVQWGVFRTGETTGELVEVYVVPSWEEHLRQHRGRMTGAEAELEARVRALSDVEPRVVHRLPV
jgi:MFS family permease